LLKSLPAGFNSTSVIRIEMNLGVFVDAEVVADDEYEEVVVVLVVLFLCGDMAINHTTDMTASTITTTMTAVTRRLTVFLFLQIGRLYTLFLTVHHNTGCLKRFNAT
jgi:hypothetical protein